MTINIVIIIIIRSIASVFYCKNTNLILEKVKQILFCFYIFFSKFKNFCPPMLSAIFFSFTLLYILSGL